MKLIWILLAFGLAFCCSCKNEKRIEARENMITVLFWLMEESERQLPHKFNLISINYGNCHVQLMPEDHEKIKQLRSVLSGSNETFPLGVNEIRTRTAASRKGTLVLATEEHKLTVKFFTTDSDLTFDIAIPGDGMSQLTLPGISGDFDTLMRQWCLQ